LTGAAQSCSPPETRLHTTETSIIIAISFPASGWAQSAAGHGA
jgi:hypothetical protein